MKSHKTKQQSKEESTSIYTDKFIPLWINGVVCILLIVFGLIPFMNTMKERTQKVQESELASLHYSEMKLGNLKAQKEFEQFEGQELLALALPAEDDIITFVETFEDAAQSNNVTHNLQLRTEGREETGGIAYIPVQLRVTGTLADSIQFLVDIEKENFYINVASITIGNEIGVNQQTISIEGETFWSTQQ